MEGIVSDLAHGTLLNIWAEKGYPTQWKHDRKSMIVQLATCTAVAGGGIFLRARKSDKPRRRYDPASRQKN